ncbi:hypothetical protein BN7_2576 [Wickerhamomyces ciferrii]|uniref:Uncharacterized protein n=1 Tax=Wickerhamomyces ciferrii (strain ATCC 14091 / BCRC 22168 / CBS 111 / JCM 3599 / NBRC 0793 / NRRL Y-1031 F-60-10) TaxID=1206466 RepID=K0KNQ5_WICCF|nr:uncharacterized protein BN7_2576 [Wickerhamomyces ciferrii]CCH43029.1 hypothetical protein BN7_2576 [Wickerhamomyces ciferrii]
MIFNHRSKVRIRSPFQNHQVSDVSFADDVNLLINNRKELNSALKNFKDYEEISNMKINLKKSNLILIKEQCDYEDEYEDCPLNVIKMKFAKDIKFLGMPFNGESNWEETLRKFKDNYGFHY